MRRSSATRCSICLGRATGFGWFNPTYAIHDPRRGASRLWFCSLACQALWSARAKGGWRMVDLTEEEAAAIGATMKRVALLMDEIGWNARLADLSEAQVRALIEEAVEGFREAMSDIARQQDPEIPF